MGQSADEISARDDADQTSVPDHWDTLNAVSVEGCRNSFQIVLVRNGCDVPHHDIAGRLAMCFRIGAGDRVGIGEAVKPPLPLGSAPIAE